MRTHLDELNPAQRAAVEHGCNDSDAASSAAALLIIAGAGSGKTKTLAHRVAHLLLHGAEPERVLLLTFTRRAAHEMTRRARHICAKAHSVAHARQLHWAGTFHSIANRLLRLHAASLGLSASFTVLDRSDAEDLLNLLRDELGFSNMSARFRRSTPVWRSIRTW